MDSTDLTELTAWLQGGKHESASLLLWTHRTTQLSSDDPETSTMRMEDWLGGTSFTWIENLADDIAVADSDYSDDESSSDDEPGDESSEYEESD